MSNNSDNGRPFSGAFPTSTVVTNMRFPLKVYHMLECGKYSHIINWLPDGASFSILDEALLVSDVLPFYCPGARYETFIRKLNKYGMETLEKRRKSDIGRIFSSALFIRGREDLLHTMTRTGAKPSTKVKVEATPSMPNKRSKSVDDRVIIGSHLSGPSFHNLRSSHLSSQVAPEAAALAEAAVPSHILTEAAGHWLTKKVVVTSVTEHVKYTFIPHDLLSEPLHSDALHTAVTNGMFSSEQLHSCDADPIFRSFSTDKAHESSTVLDSQLGPVEYVVARTPVGSFPAANTHPVVPGSTTDWSQQVSQVLGMPSHNQAIVAIGSTTLDSAVTDITAALTATVVVHSNSSLSKQPQPQAADSSEKEQEEGKVRPVPL